MAKATFAQRIEDCLRERGISQLAFCRENNLDYGSFRQYTSGMRIPHAYTLRQIACHLGVRIEWLLDGTGPRDVLTCEEEELITLYRSAGLETRRDTMRTLRGKARLKSVLQTS